MTRTQSAPGAMPELPASTRADSDGTSGRVVAFDRHTRARLDGRAGAAPAVRVLIADRQALVRAGLRALLESGGRISVVGEAATGEDAVAEAFRLRPDVVLLDATLPGLDCVEATGRMLADPRIAVMLLTATEQDERIFASLRAGARAPRSGVGLTLATPRGVVGRSASRPMTERGARAPGCGEPRGRHRRRTRRVGPGRGRRA